MLPIYIDIDGTLTDDPSGDGAPIESRVDAVKRMIAGGQPVVLWSAAGTWYARRFAQDHKISVEAAIGKPDFCIDDMESIRWDGLKIVSPKYLDEIE